MKGEPMNYNERRKYPRFNAHIPVDISLVDQKVGKTPQAKFKGVTTDISMEGLGLEMNYPAPDMLSFAPKLMGKNKELVLDLNVNLGTGGVKGVGEVRWARIHPPSALRILKMGLFLKEMRDDEKEKWTNFVMSQSKNIPQNVSFQQTYSGHRLIKFLYKSIKYLISSNLLMDYIFPIMLVSSSVIVWWFVEIRYYHVMIPCGIPIIMILLIRSKFFSRKYLKPKCEIPHSFLRTLYQRLRGNRSAGPLK